MALKVEISVGELLDKITILEIKSERIDNSAKLLHVNQELEILRQTWAKSPLSTTDISDPMKRLKAVNVELWDIEDGIRLKEGAGEFDHQFIELARSVYHRNDVRAAIKKEINLLLGSDLVEEKSYTDYSRNTEQQ